MAVKIANTTITMTRGDTLKTKVNILGSDGTPYVPRETDKIVFAAKKSYSDDDTVIFKEIPYDTCILHLEPNDTKLLDQPCTYRYEIEITMSDGTVDTFIKGNLKITEEVQ